MSAFEGKRSRHNRIRDWDEAWRRGRPPWETPEVNGDLQRVVIARRQELRKAAFLELGCGTGREAVWLATQGFQVTAIDASVTAIERARTRAEQADALLRIVLSDVFSFARHGETFDFVYDIGFYHYIRRTDLKRYLDLLWEMTHPGAYYFTVCGAAELDTKSELGPPTASVADIRWEIGRLFEVVEIVPCRLGSPYVEEGFPAHACLLRRPVVGRSSGRN
ncbi:MAG: class I SAM-dependent methyltransferase [Planctomycetia bacterium]|nr:class I SAM-dependent methyltransferase [Planctomycetia bacterium]